VPNFYSNSIDFIPVSPSSVEEAESILPELFELYQNYPNPFNPETKISYQIPQRDHVTLKVYDILSNEVSTLVNEEKSAGIYEVIYDASNLSSGIYFYQLIAGKFIATKKMLLLK